MTLMAHINAAFVQPIPWITAVYAHAEFWGVYLFFVIARRWAVRVDFATIMATMKLGRKSIASASTDLGWTDSMPTDLRISRASSMTPSWTPLG